MNNSLNAKNSAILATCLLLFMTNCTGQIKETVQQECNRKAIDKSIAKKLPKGLCVPNDYTVDEIISSIDFNKDKSDDVVIRYSEYPYKNGITRYYALCQRVSDTVFVVKKELKNVLPPYLENIYLAASGSDSVASSLVNNYPYDVEVSFVRDTIKISHLIPEFYGKTYFYTYNQTTGDWYLQKVQYWIGNLDERDVERMDLSIKLVNKNHLENKIPNNELSIDQFNLIESKKEAFGAEKEYLNSRYNLFEWSRKNK